MAFEIIKNSLTNVLDGLGLDSKNLAAISILEREFESLGNFASVSGIKNRCLYIEVNDSAHLQECYFHKRELLKKLSDMSGTTGQDVVWNIKFFLKGMQKSAGRSSRAKPASAHAPRRTIRTGARKKFKRK